MAISDRITSIEKHIKESYQELEGIGIDTTGVNNNLENIPKLIDGYWETLPKVTGEGTSITLDDTKEGKMKINLKGNTSQEGTPTPDAPQDIHVVSGNNSINVVGKNLFSLKNITNATSLGVERIINNSELKLNGTTTGSGRIIGRQTTKITLLAGTYSVLVQKKSGTVTPNDKQTAFYFRKPNGTEITSFLLNNYWGNYSFKTTFVLSEATELYVELYCNGAGYTLDNLELQFHIESGYNLTPTYEAYIGESYPVNLPVENLFELPTTQTINGITFTNNGNGTFNLSGTASAIADFAISKELNTIANGKFTISSKSSGYSLQMTFYNGNNWLSTPINKLPTELIKTSNITIPSNATRYDLVIRVPSGYTVNLINETVQFEKGSKANSYTPFGTTPIELCKIGDYQDIIKKSTGKNLITFKNFNEVTQNGVTTTPNNSELKLNGTVTQANPIFNSQSLDLMLPKGTYTITYKIARGSVTRPSGDIAFYLRNGTTNIATVTIYQILSNNNTFSRTFTIDNNASLYFYAYSNAGNIVFNNTVLQVQLEKRTQSTSFEPYGTGWYLKKEIGKFYSNSTTGWSYDNNHRYYRAIDNIVVPPNNDTVGQGFCNVGLVTANQTLPNSTTTGLAIHPISRLYISENVYNNISTTPTLLYYAYITPIYTEITDSTLIGQLNALTRSYTSQTNISQESNDLASLLNATALEEM